MRAVYLQVPESLLHERRDGRAPTAGTSAGREIPFYADVGVRELWVIDRDTRALEVHELGDHGARTRAAGADGWVRSALGIELTFTADHRLGLRLAAR